jgi:hypothetical protein
MHVIYANALNNGTKEGALRAFDRAIDKAMA